MYVPHLRKMVSADMANIERCWNYPKVPSKLTADRPAKITAGKLWAEMGKDGIVGWWKDIKQKNARNQVTIFTQNSPPHYRRINLELKWVKGG